jgi:hypothetical protein
VLLQAFFMLLFRTVEGFVILCQCPDTCRQLSAALSGNPASAAGEMPLLPRTLPTASAPESALATQLAFLATAKNAWDNAVIAAAGSPDAMQAMHTLLHLTEDEEMCQVRCPSNCADSVACSVHRTAVLDLTILQRALIFCDVAVVSLVLSKVTLVLSSMYLLPFGGLLYCLAAW